MKSCELNESYYCGYEEGEKAGKADAQKGVEPRKFPKDDDFNVGFAEGYEDGYNMTILDELVNEAD